MYLGVINAVIVPVIPRSAIDARGDEVFISDVDVVVAIKQHLAIQYKRITIF